jgi:hypothetical protein
MSLADITVAQLKLLGNLDGKTARFAKRLLVTSYEEFVQVLYEDLDACLRYIVQTRNHRLKEGEDRTTVDIIGQLISSNYDAKHDEMHGGHCDIVVSHPAGYVWIAECKIHRDYDHLRQGFDQLCTRYLSGIPGSDHGSLIVFVRNENTSAVMMEWVSRLQTYGYENLACGPCKVWQDLGMISTHTPCLGAGRRITVRHTALPLHFAPEA